MAEIRRKLVIVGDGACGKTCLLMYVSSRLSAFRINISIIDDSFIAHSTIIHILIRVPSQCLLKGHIPWGKSRFPDNADYSCITVTTNLYSLSPRSVRVMSLPKEKNNKTRCARHHIHIVDCAPIRYFIIYILLTQPCFPGLCPHCLWELRRRCWGRWQARRVSLVGYGWSGGLRPSPTSVLPRFPRYSHLLRCWFSRFTGQRSGEGQYPI